MRGVRGGCWWRERTRGRCQTCEGGVIVVVGAMQVDGDVNLSSLFVDDLNVAGSK